MVKLAAGEHDLRAGRGRYSTISKCCLCQNCTLYEAETLDHIVYRCPHPELVAVRETKGQRLKETMPTAMQRDVLSQTDLERLNLLLSGLNGGYIPEWQSIYMCIAEMFSAIYGTSMKLKNNGQ